MLAGAPVTARKVTSCATPVMLNRTIEPTEMVKKAGLNTRPGVNTSTVVVTGVVTGGVPEFWPGDVGASFEPEQAESMALRVQRSSVMTNRSRCGIHIMWRKTVTATMLVVTLTTACSKGEGATGPVTPPPTPVGAYTLRTIDAKVMPYAMYTEPDYTLEVISGTLSVMANGKWVSKSVTRETVAGNISTYSDSTFGTWSVLAVATIAAFINTETAITSNATWTAAEVTVNEVHGTVTRKLVYKRN